MGGKRKTKRRRSPSDRKAEEIEALLAKDEVDLWRLRELALTDGGLVNDSIRKRAWPKLVGLHGEEAASLFTSSSVASARYVPAASTDSSASPTVGGGEGVTTTGSSTSTGTDTFKDQEEDEDEATNHKMCIYPYGGDGDNGVAIIDPSSLDSKAARRGVVAQCLDADQIERDIARCTWHLLSGTQRQRRRKMALVTGRQQRMESLLKRKQRRLGNLINLVLVQSYDCAAADEDERLRYYQGYHDVSCIFLNVLGGSSIAAGAPGNELGAGLSTRTSTSMNSNSSSIDQAARTASAMGLDLPSSVLLQVSRCHFRDYMRSNFASVSAALRLIMMPLIAVLDPEVHSKLIAVDMEPFFAISWIITWFSHDVRDTDLVKRLFDAFLVSHPLMPVYMTVAMLLHPENRAEIIHAENDFSAVHTTLTHLPRNSCGVGWKYKGGLDGGYVSDDEEIQDEDDTTLGSSTVGEGSFFSDDVLSSDVGPFMPQGGDDGGDDYSMATSQQATSTVASSSILSPGGGPRVPFQELIDMAISFMRRIPPRKLVPLAKRYFFDDAILPLLAQVPSIALLRPPPAWALAPVAPSDEVLKHRALGRRLSSGALGVTPGKRVRLEEAVCSAKLVSGDAGESSDGRVGLTPRVDEKAGYIKLLLVNGEAVGTVQAVVASGMGPDGEEENRIRRRRRRRKVRIVIIAGIVVFVAIVALVPSKVILPRPFRSAPNQGYETTSSSMSTEEKTCLAPDFVPGSSADDTVGTECSVLPGSDRMDPATNDMSTRSIKNNLVLEDVAKTNNSRSLKRIVASRINGSATIRDIIKKKICNTSTSLIKRGAEVQQSIRSLSQRGSAISIDDSRRGMATTHDIIRKKISTTTNLLIKGGAKVQQSIRSLFHRAKAMSVDDYRRLFQAAVRQVGRIIEEANMLSGVNMHHN